MSAGLWEPLFAVARATRAAPRQGAQWARGGRALGPPVMFEDGAGPGPAPEGADSLLLLLEPTAAEAAALPGDLKLFVASARGDMQSELTDLTRPALRPEVEQIEAAAQLNEAWRHVRRTGRVFTQLKVASSLDGRIATREGESKWITQEAARAAGRALRGQLDAICVGVNTVLADDPRLNARSPGAPDPVRVVLDSTLRTPPSAKIIKTARAQPTWLFTVGASCADCRLALERAGARVIASPPTPGGRVNLSFVLEFLAAEGLSSLLVEGGGQVHGAFVDAGLVDKLSWFFAPMLIGGAQAKPAVAGLGAGRLSEALRLTRMSLRQIGPDFLAEGYPAAPEQELSEDLVQTEG